MTPVVDNRDPELQRWFAALVATDNYEVCRGVFADWLADRGDGRAEAGPRTARSRCGRSPGWWWTTPSRAFP